MITTLTYSASPLQNPAEIIRAYPCDPRRFPAVPCPVQPLKGLRDNRAHILSYRALAPTGAGSVHWKQTTTEQHLRGRRWLHTSPTAHYSLLTANSLTYTFSAKERDSETGLSYFGSRYYSSDMSVWLSVDPMAAKYPSLSPYVYCSNNPVRVVDPDGEEIWIVGEDGNQYKYNNGNFYTKDGKLYTPEAGSFLSTAGNAIDKLKGTTTCNKLISADRKAHV